VSDVPAREAFSELSPKKKKIGEVTMPNGKRNPNQRAQFAVAMALGQRVSFWAKQNGVPRRTCYTWRKTQEFKASVQEIRRRTVDRAVGQLTRNLTRAVGRIALLATEAKSECIQLHAARAVLREFIATREHFDYEERMTEIERRFQAVNNNVP
jgi:hypothetical protein